MLYTSEIAGQVAKLLLELKAVRLNPQQPFEWASGWKSPIYCDNRLTLSFPKYRTFIRQSLAAALSDSFGKPEIIAGVATAGIPQGVLVAEQLGLPFVYVRTSAKDHGMKNQVEGLIRPDAYVVVIEDLISTGGSSLKAVEALQYAGFKVKGVASVFTYGFEQANNAFSNVKVPLISLCDYSTLLQVAVEEGYLNASELPLLESWRANPESWGQ